MPLRPQRNDILVRHNRRCARKAVVAFDRDAIPAAPQFPAALQREASQHVGAQRLVVIQKINPPVVDDGGGMSFAGTHGPQNGIGFFAGGNVFGGADDVRKTFAPEAGPFPRQRRGLQVVVAHKELADAYVVGLASRFRRPVVGPRRLKDKRARRRIDMPSDNDAQVDKRCGDRNKLYASFRIQAVN